MGVAQGRCQEPCTPQGEVDTENVVATNMGVQFCESTTITEIALPEKAEVSPVEPGITSEPGITQEDRTQSKVRRSLLLERKLTTDLEIMRGVTLQSTLRGLGSLWRKSPLDMPVADRERLWHASRQIKRFDVFFSHTWRTKGKWKFLSLSLQLSWLHILAYWFGAVLLAESLFILGVLPPVGSPWKVTTEDLECYIPMSTWGVFIAPLFSLTAFFVAPYLHPSKEMCFLDVACIHQVDHELMERGIYGLGGFLKNTKHMQILWSPPYLSRLWCIFELAAFRMANPNGKVTVRPLFMEVTVVVLWTGAMVIALLWTVLKIVTVSLSLLLVFPVLIPAVGIVHSLRKNLRMKHALFDEMSNFDLETVECRKDFDRKFVYAAITEWYGGPEAFTEYVRGPLRKHLLFDLRSARIPLKYSLVLATVVVTIGVDSLASFLRVIAFDPDACTCKDGGSVQLAAVHYTIAYFIGAILGVFTCWLTVMVRFAIFLCNRFARPWGGQAVDILQTCLVFTMWGVVAVAGILCGAFAYRTGILLASVWLVSVTFLAWLVHGGWDRLARHFRSAGQDEQQTAKQSCVQ